jgi:non-heme chloroperoxidase
MPFIHTRDATSLFYSDWGEGKPAVFAHAWALNSDMWAYQIPDFVDSGLRCVTYDRRGHGRSDRPRDGYDYDTFADDLASLIEHLDLHEITLIAHSLGCSEIIRYLSRHSDARVKRVVLLAPTMPRLRKAIDNPDGLDERILAASAEALKTDVPQWCADNAPPFFGRSSVSPGLTDWVTRQIVDTPLKVLLDTAATFATADFRGELPSVRVPTLILHGDLDASAPIELTGQKTAELIPGSRLLVYEGSGHGLYAADHERVNSDILAFINRQRALAA